METSNKVLTLKGIACQFQPPSHRFEEQGTMQEFRDKLLDKPFDRKLIVIGNTATHYTEKVGEYLFNILDYENIPDVIGTLESVNRWARNTGNIAHEDSWDRFFCMYSAVESEAFKQAPKSERIDLIVSLSEQLTDEMVRNTSKYWMGLQFLDNHMELMYGAWKGKYPTLEQDVTDIWNREVCEKIVFPYLEKQI
jgi:hypothetical protein